MLLQLARQQQPRCRVGAGDTLGQPCGVAAHLAEVRVGITVGVRVGVRVRVRVSVLRVTNC